MTECVYVMQDYYVFLKVQFDISVLSQGCSDASGFIQAVLGLLLPLGYEHDPGLVLLALMPNSRLCDSVWQQLMGLLQGLAQGHMLVLMQVRRLL